MPSTAASSPPRPSPPPPPPPPGRPGRASRSAQAPWKRRRRQLATAHVRAGTASARASSAPSKSGRRGATSRSGMSYRAPAAAPPPPSPRRSRLPAQSWRGRSHARRSGAASRRVRRRASCAPRACSSTTPPRRQPSRRREREPSCACLDRVAQVAPSDSPPFPPPPPSPSPMCTGDSTRGRRCRAGSDASPVPSVCPTGPCCWVGRVPSVRP